MSTIIRKDSITFPNNNKAEAVFPGPEHKSEEIAAALHLGSYKSIILILGGADTLPEELKPRLIQWFGRGIARAAVEAEAVIVDGGTHAGVMALMGEGVANHGSRRPLIGIAPASRVMYPGSTGMHPGTPPENDRTALDPNHSHFVLVEGQEWSSKSFAMFDLIDALSVYGLQSGRDTQEKTPRPRLAILAGGRKTTKNEVLYAVRRKIPLIILAGSGGMADEIVAAAGNKALRETDGVMAEILEDGNIRFHSLKTTVKGIERLIIRKLGIDKVLDQAWHTFAKYDFNAGLQQKRFEWLQISILVVGVLGTLLVIIQQKYSPHTNGPDAVLLTAHELFERGDKGWWLLHRLLILVPITLTVLVSAATRFKQGTKWLLLRAGAEAIKREIYRYRVRAMYYAEDLLFYLNTPDSPPAAEQSQNKLVALSAEQQLSKRIEEITLRTMRTEVNLSSLKPYDGKEGFPPYCKKSNDDGYSILTPERYVAVRLENQLEFYQGNAPKLDRKLKRLYWLTFIIGGVSTFLAAIDLQIWIALATGIIGAIGTYLGYRQTENTLTKYNQAATDLSNVKAWWNSLSSEEQARQINIDSLVEHTEQVLQSELDGWIQQMQNALAELRKGQEPSSEKEENKEPNNSGKSRREDQSPPQPEE